MTVSLPNAREAAMTRNTKIVATYGPATASAEKVAEILDAGADVIRLNFSHGALDSHREAITTIRNVASKMGKHTAILQDLRGPKIRVGVLEPDMVLLKHGDSVRLYPGSGPGSAMEIPVEGCPSLTRDLKTGHDVLLNDGAIRLHVKHVGADYVECEVVVGGELSSRKGVNFPDSSLEGIATVTEKDRADLEFGLEHGVDIVALSFVRSADDIRLLRSIMKEQGKMVPIVAKIEKREALKDLNRIVAEADGVMVARGDLGVETRLEEVTIWQKEIIRECNRQGKVVITATQMLESMIEHPVPTRAEVSDVANAIMDGTDAVMLSGETAVGSFPREAVEMMVRIASRTERVLDRERLLAQHPFTDEVRDAVAHAACVVAHEVRADALICRTRSGATARLVSRYRPRCPIIAVSPKPATVRQLGLVWGVQAIESAYVEEDEGLMVAAIEDAKRAGLVREGQTVVVTAGISSGRLHGETNMVRVEVL